MVGAVGIEPTTKWLCLPATTFVASKIEFVVWTVSSSHKDACRTVSTPLLLKIGFGSGLPTILK